MKVPSTDEQIALKVSLSTRRIPAFLFHPYWFLPFVIHLPPLAGVNQSLQLSIAYRPLCQKPLSHLLPYFFTPPGYSFGLSTGYKYFLISF